jgi:uncharacterized iron-regulated membrane protein
MSVWQRWVRQPQRVWLRRALFQIHLWTGLALGLYVVMLSVTGSALVYRNELDRFFATPRPTFDPKATRLTTEQLQAKAESLYPELLLERPGRFWNGIGSAILSVTALTGLVVWWPGVSRWKRSLGIKWSSGWRRFNWDLHSAIGFWLFLFMLMWGISGFYLGVPEPFSNFVDSISDPDAILGERPGDIVLTWLTRLHFGRWRNAPVLKAIWAIVGLIPAMMLVTGVIMWWNRVLRKRPNVSEATEVTI